MRTETVNIRLPKKMVDDLKCNMQYDVNGKALGVAGTAQYFYAQGKQFVKLSKAEKRDEV